MYRLMCFFVGIFTSVKDNFSFEKSSLSISAFVKTIFCLSERFMTQLIMTL